MSRPVTLFTGQWADMPLRRLAEKASEWGYDGLELACWGDHFDPFKAAESDQYCNERKALLEEFGLQCWAFSTHLAGQLVLDNLDERHNGFVPPKIAGDHKKMRQWAIDTLKACAHAAKNMGVGVVPGFTGSSIWHLIYSFPPVSPAMIEDGFKLLAERFNPILDVYNSAASSSPWRSTPRRSPSTWSAPGARWTRWTAGPNSASTSTPATCNGRASSRSAFIRAFPDRIYHVHMKDCAVTLTGTEGILSSYLNFGDPRARLGLPQPGPRRRGLRGHHPRAEPHRLHGPAVGRMGRFAEWTANTAPPKPANSCATPTSRRAGLRSTRSLISRRTKASPPRAQRAPRESENRHLPRPRAVSQASNCICVAQPPPTVAWVDRRPHVVADTTNRLRWLGPVRLSPSVRRWVDVLLLSVLGALFGAASSRLLASLGNHVERLCSPWPAYLFIALSVAVATWFCHCLCRLGGLRFGHFWHYRAFLGYPPTWLAGIGGFGILVLCSKQANVSPANQPFASALLAVPHLRAMWFCRSSA